MSDLSLVLLAAGESSRFRSQVKKQWIRTGERPLWQFVADRLLQSGHFADVIIIGHKDEVAYMKLHGDYTVHSGGASRQASLTNALHYVNTPFVMVTDVARGCVDTALIGRLIDAKTEADCIVPALKVHDTVVYDNATIDRSALLRIQTPQLSRTDRLRSALQTEALYTDESSAIVAAGGSRFFIDGDEQAHKLTTLADLAALECLQGPSKLTLSGTGIDVHAFDEGGSMVLGGVKIDHPVGFKAHSDGDVALHALIDALLGAAGIGDIGMLFPDTDPVFEGIDSMLLLEKTFSLLKRYGFKVNNVDLSIAAQTPRLSPYKDAMRRRIAEQLELPPVRVGIKATTTEKLGFVGRKEGVAVFASATLTYLDWTQI